MNIATWHVIGTPFQPSMSLISGIQLFSNSLRTFHVHDSLWLDLEVFCDLLNALGSCWELKNLALPTDLTFLRDKTTEQRIAHCEQMFSRKLALSLGRPRIVSLQLVSTNHRYRFSAKKPMKAIHTVWITHPNCPLSFAHTSQLIVGQGTDLQRVLALTHTLVCLEICCESPRLWPDYGECFCIQLLDRFSISFL